MPIALDEQTLRRLMLIKQLHHHALTLAAPPASLFRRVMATVTFDLAVDSCLRAVILSLDPNADLANAPFPSLLKSADKALAAAGLSPLPHTAAIIKAHKVRNDAQHNGRYPSQEELDDCRTDTSGFLRSLIPEVWAKSFDLLALSDIVINSRARSFLATAEQALAAQEHTTAVKAASSALAWSLQNIRDPFVGKRPTPQSTGILISLPGEYMPRDMLKFISEGGVRMDEDLLMSFIRMQQTVLYLAAGISPAHYFQLVQLAGFIVFDSNNEPRHYQTPDTHTPEQAEFVVAMCSDAVLQIEAVFGDVQSPAYNNYRI